MLTIFQPKSVILQNYIDFFYVFDNNRSENVSYIAFPHVNTAISFFKGADIRRGNHELNITSDDRSIIEILGKYTRPVFVNYHGYCEELAIVFKPLGVNHFFDNDLIQLSPFFSQELKNNQWTEFSDVLFSSADMSSRIEILEAFLLRNIKELDFQLIKKLLDYLEDFDANYSIDEIARLNGIHLKTFQRIFTKYLTCAPSEYKRISRFRHSLSSKLLSNELKTLTTVSNESNYYDQSYFIREYQKLTQQSPKAFFDGIIALNEKKVVWMVR